MNTQNGNALFLILIAVALLGTLSYAVTNSNRGNISTMTKERAQLYATEILEYSQNISNAVGQLRLRGCMEHEISFENPIVTTGYANTSAPLDNSCHVFHPSGGAISWQTPDNSVIEGTASAESWRFNANNVITNVGTNADGAASADLALFLQDVQQAICIEINNKLSLTNPSGNPPIDQDATINTAAGFIGNYTDIETISDADNALSGKTAGCLTSGQNTFYKVLIAR